MIRRHIHVTDSSRATKGYPSRIEFQKPTQVNWEAGGKRMDSVFEAIGRTPLVRLNRVARRVRPAVYAKLEMFSPTGSLKDRIYFNMFRRATQSGALRPGMEVLECSTGNAGIACAWVSAVMGYKCTIVMPEGMSEERKKLMRAYGAEIVFTPGGESDVDLALQKLEEIRKTKPRKYFVPAQFDNPYNPEAHYLTTGPEIWDQIGGDIDIFVTTQGTGGMVSGIGRYLKEKKPDVRIFASEPAECPLLAHRRWGPHKIEGIGDGFVPRNLHLEVLTGIVTVTSDEAISMARRIPAEEGIFCGISSAANVVSAIKLARKFPKAKSIVTIICDTGQRYFSTEMFGVGKEVEIPEREHPMDAYTVEQLDQFQEGWVIVE